MNYCRSTRELKTLQDLGISREAYYNLQNVNLDTLILGIRNDLLLSNLPDFINPDKRNLTAEMWYEKMDYYYEVKEALIIEGFIRPDIEFFKNPEKYFAQNYAVPLGLADRRICMPYFYSNEVYETYDFCYDRLRLILDILEDELTKEQFDAVKSDIMYMDYMFADVSEMDLKFAKMKLKEKRRSLKWRFETCFR